MHRKYRIAEAMHLKTWLFQKLKDLCDKEKYPSIKQFFLTYKKEWPKTYFFRKSDPILHVFFGEKEMSIFDDDEMIEVVLEYTQLDALHSFLKHDRNIKKQSAQGKTQIQLLTEFFQSWQGKTIAGKPYLVYDIETTSTASDLRATTFYLWYAREPTGEKGEYRLIMPEDLEDFVQYMLDFDGYIVWFNNVWFDNPVCVYNTRLYGQDAIDAINAKSVDIFLLLYRLTKKRIGLNAVTKAWVGIEKTLWSGAEGDELMKKWQETGEEKYLTTFQEYCKNDVRMTAMVLLYLLYHKEILVDGEYYTFDEVMMTEEYREEPDVQIDPEATKTLF